MANLFNSPIEQVRSGLTDMAITLAKYKKDLVEEGFSEEEAFLIARDWQKLILGGSMNG